MQLKCSDTPSINISFGFVLGTLNTQVHIWLQCVCVVCCVPTVGTGAPLFKVSPWALKLWLRARRDFSPSLQHPSQPQKYYQHFPREKQRGNVIWKRGVNPPQQQLLPNHNNLGKGCGLYFMGREGPRMFIYLSPQSALMCVCVRACVCLRLDVSVIVLFFLAQGKTLRSQVTF